MKPISFIEQNVVFAESQPEYLPLPAHKSADGTVVTCWGMTWRERIKAMLTGKVWFMTLTFNQPLQPQLPSVDAPIWREAAE